MLSQIEYKLVKNNYIEMCNTDDFLCYAKRDDPIAQISIKKHTNSYSLSFPLKNSKFNYSTNFNNIDDLKIYIERFF